MQQPYVILHSPLLARGGLELFASGMEHLASVEVAELDGSSASRFHDGTQGTLAAPLMPIQLIQPKVAPPETTAWGIAAVNADATQRDGSGVKVAVLDTGIDRSSSAFNHIRDIQEEDFTCSENGDRNGHGSHCAGTIFGRTLEGHRIGVAPGVETALIGKVLDDAGGGTTENLYRGILWASTEGADVISMSIGFDFARMFGQLHSVQQIPLPAAASIAMHAYQKNLRLFDALICLLQARQAFSAGSVIVAASGNESARPTYTVSASLPGAAKGVLSVGAVRPGKGTTLEVADFSNTEPTLCAPGSGILSVQTSHNGGGLVAMSGTSMAAPHVAGIAALWWHDLRETRGPQNVTAELVETQIRATARRDCFWPDYLPRDHGLGLVTAP